MRICLSLMVPLMVLSVLAQAHAQTADLVDRSAFRVCADPANMPFSNKRGEGFENKLAELFAGKLGVPVEYTWFPQAVGFIRRTLKVHECDIVIGYAQGHELVQNTNHYYRSAYVLVTKIGSQLAEIASLDDPRLQGKAIGIIAGTPPATLMALNGLIEDAKSFALTVDRRHQSPAENMIEEIIAGTLDAGVLWGPIGGYWQKRSEKLAIQPLVNETRGPQMVYRITAGIRPMEPDWKHELNDLIGESQDEINTILMEFGVPILDEDDQLILPEP